MQTCGESCLLGCGTITLLLGGLSYTFLSALPEMLDSGIGMLAQPPLHILLVDPDPGAAQVTRALVKRAAPESRITVEPDALRALQQFQQLRPDVVIIDPSPTPLAGLELIRLARTIQPAAKIIVLTSQPTRLLRRQMNDLGVVRYLEKPAPLPVADLQALFAR